MVSQAQIDDAHVAFKAHHEEHMRRVYARFAIDESTTMNRYIELYRALSGTPEHWPEALAQYHNTSPWSLVPEPAQ